MDQVDQNATSRAFEMFLALDNIPLCPQMENKNYDLFGDVNHI